MIDFDLETTELNAQILLQGMWYAELPELLDMDRLCGNIKSVLSMQDTIGYGTFTADQDGFITDFKKISSPSYLRAPGVEPITYYTFKKNHSFREMQIPNLIHYIAFIYNSLWSFEDIFDELYCNSEKEEVVGNSNSYVVLNEEFYIPIGYEEEDEIELGVFTPQNNKIQGNAVISANRMRYEAMAEAYLYAVKMDIESFFPNVYTHILRKSAIWNHFVG